jgi:hypothetical protein
LHEL